ncbi:hypothetical protein FOL47_002465 [Perkinsus chesapeaki]|uniref:Amino acid transporter transmembrane domain-containing protein n=1 Tax=Perkinsus chesapeaki TaxID=330153 RepID=A0A7J6KPH5_PERCH|nr:hypothetical protein FOL47_002465 [Perkinsus chesapeaki]
MASVGESVGFTEELLADRKQQAQPPFGQVPETKLLVTEYQAGLLSEPEFDQSFDRELEQAHGKYKKVSQNGKQRMEVKDAVYALVCTAIGAGVLTLPYALAQSGLILGTGMLSYGSLARATCGKWAEMLTSICIALTTWLVMGSYMIVMADLMADTGLSDYG